MTRRTPEASIRKGGSQEAPLSALGRGEASARGSRLFTARLEVGDVSVGASSIESAATIGNVLSGDSAIGGALGAAAATLTSGGIPPFAWSATGNLPAETRALCYPPRHDGMQALLQKRNEAWDFPRSSS